MPRLRSTTNASSMLPFVSCNAFRQSPIGAPDFSRRSFTNFASIFSLTVLISLFSLYLKLNPIEERPNRRSFDSGRRTQPPHRMTTGQAFHHEQTKSVALIDGGHALHNALLMRTKD